MSGRTGGDESGTQTQAQGPAPTFCDFCGQPTAKVGPMIEGNALVQAGVKNAKSHICSACVEACDGIFLQHQKRHALDTTLPTPRELVDHLNNRKSVV